MKRKRTTSLRFKLAFILVLGMVPLYGGCGGDGDEVGEEQMERPDAPLDEQVSDLPEVNPELEAQINDLILQLSDSTVEVRRTAVLRLAEMNHPATVPGLMKALSDENEEIAQIATDALVRIGEPSVPALARVLGSENDEEEDAAVQVLVEVGEVAVIGLLREWSTQVKQNGFRETKVVAYADSVRDVIKEIGEPAVAVLIRALDDADELVGVLAARQLYWVDESKKDLVAARLERALEGETDRVRVTATIVLYGVDPSKVDRILAVLQAIDTPEAAEVVQNIEQAEGFKKRADLVRSEPEEFGEISENGVLILIFDNPPVEVTVDGTPAVVQENEATWQATGLKPDRAPADIRVEWTNTDGSQRSRSLKIFVLEDFSAEILGRWWDGPAAGVILDIKPDGEIARSKDDGETWVFGEYSLHGDEITLTFDGVMKHGTIFMDKNLLWIMYDDGTGEVYERQII